MSSSSIVDRARVLLVLCRPPLVFLFVVVAGLGVGQGGRPGDLRLMALVLVPVVAFLVFAVAVNDLSDEAIDRVNLAGDPSRPLVTGSAYRRDLVVVAGAAAVLAIAGAAPLGGWAVLVVAGGLAFALAYSLEPLRLTTRGLLAPLALPLGFVAVPFALGALAARGRLDVADLGLLGGLYVAFVGRLVLKDLRDVRGDELFGKRTFLVRHGRRTALVVAGSCWVAGTAVLAAAAGPTPAEVSVLGVLAAATVGGLVALDRSTSARRDEWLVSASAILGRGTLVVLLAHQSLVALGWTGFGPAAILTALGGHTLGLAAAMARQGPSRALRVPDGVAADTTSSTFFTSSSVLLPSP